MTDAQTLLQEGLSAFRARAYDKALQAWRALLDADPDNQQVQQLVERTEALAAEGHLVHTLKEELADLREELATTRQARNDLLIEMARVHKRYQAREARLWRLQEEREWELREALAHAELSGIVGDSAQGGEFTVFEDYSSLDPEHAPDTLEDAHQEIQKLLHALNQAQQRIRALELSDTLSPDDDEILPRETSPATHTRPSRTVPARPAPRKTKPARTVPAGTDADLSESAESSPADIEITHKSSSKHTQTSRTLAGARHLVEPEDTHEEDDDDSLSFDGPLISDEWLNAPDSSDDEPSVSDDLISLVKVVSKPSKSKDAPSDPDVDDDASSKETIEPSPSHESEADQHASQEDAPADDVFQIEEDSDEVFHLDTDISAAAPDAGDSPPPSDHGQPPADPDQPASAEASAQPHSRSAIPDTARIAAQPMADKDIADGFTDELTSALGSTPAPPRLFTGVQPDLPDIDIFENEPQVMSPEDLEKHPTAVPVRYKEDPSIDDPIARYLLTHVDGVSTFMELRGTVGLPPAAVDRGFRILLAHKVIRVQHQ